MKLKLILLTRVFVKEVHHYQNVIPIRLAGFLKTLIYHSCLRNSVPQLNMIGGQQENRDNNVWRLSSRENFLQAHQARYLKGPFFLTVQFFVASLSLQSLLPPGFVR